VVTAAVAKWTKLPPTVLSKEMLTTCHVNNSMYCLAGDTQYNPAQKHTTIVTIMSPRSWRGCYPINFPSALLGFGEREEGREMERKKRCGRQQRKKRVMGWSGKRKGKQKRGVFPPPPTDLSYGNRVFEKDLRPTNTGLHSGWGTVLKTATK